MLRYDTLLALLSALALLVSLTACDIGTVETPDEGEDTTSRAAPSNLEGVSQDGVVSLEWSAPDAADLGGYRVYRSESAFSAPGEAERLSGEALHEDRTYDDTNAQNGTTYYYRVAAVDQSGNESALSNMVQKTPFPDPPDEP